MHLKKNFQRHFQDLWHICKIHNRSIQGLFSFPSGNRSHGVYGEENWPVWSNILLDYPSDMKGSFVMFSESLQN